MAVAAYDHRRFGHPHHAAWRSGDRFRYHLPRTRPHVAIGRRAQLSWHRRRDRAKLDSLPSNDDALADAIKHSRVVVGQAGSAVFEPETAPEAALQTGFAVRGPDPSPYLVTFPGLLRNVPQIEQAAAGRGLFSINPESDGIIRGVPVIMKAQGTLVPSLTMEMLRVVTGSGAILVRGRRRRRPGGRRARPRSTDRPQRAVLGPLQQTRSGALRLGQGRFARQGAGGSAERQARLIGTSAIGLLDLKTTPVDAAIPGVEVHAQILENVLSKSSLVNPNYAIGAELAIAVLFGLAIIIAAPMLSATVVVFLGGLLIAGLIGLSLYLFVEHNLLIDFTYPLISSWLIYLVLTFVNYFREQKQRRQIRSAFGYYLSPHMVEQLARSPEKLVLGGEERRMTILISDVRGFTTIAEHYKDAILKVLRG
jgi:adenylate cyclase